MSPERLSSGGVRGVRRVVAAMFPAESRAGRALRGAFNAGAGLVGTVVAPWYFARDTLAFRRAWSAPGLGMGCNLQGRTIVMLVVSHLHIDPRVRQEAQALAADGYAIVVIWPELLGHVGQPIDWGPGIAFERLTPAAGRFAYRFPGFLGAAMLAAALKHNPFAFHGHDLTTALVALTAARQTGAHAVCDFHEWFSEHVTWSNRTGSYVPLSVLQRQANKWLERFAFHQASAVITVCRSIARDMEHEYGDGTARIHVVRNISAPVSGATTAYPSLRDQLGLTQSQLLVLYQGGVGPSRALEPVIAALGQVPDCVLAIRGPSIEAYSAHYRSVAARAGVAPHQLVLLPAIPSADVVAACHGADVGLYTVADLCKSFRYALPNKVFEYMMAGLPVLVADYPEVRQLVVDNAVGLAFDPQDPVSIARSMRAMMDTHLRTGMCERLPAVLAQLDAGQEWRKMVDIYQRLEQTRPGAAHAVPVGREAMLGSLPTPVGP